MYEIVLEISALGVALFCLVDCVKNRPGVYLPIRKGWMNRLKDQHFTYLFLLHTLIISALSSVLEVSMEKYFRDKSVFSLMLLNEIYFIFHTVLSVIFVLYIINITGALKKKGLSFFAVFIIPLVFAEILIITNPFTKRLFYIDENMRYNRGPLMWALYAVAIFYVAFGVLYFLLNMKMISKLDQSATFILMFIAVLGICIQGVLSITVELFFESIAFLGFMLLLETRPGKAVNVRREKMSKSFIYVLALIFLTVIAMNINLIYHAGTDQTGRIGEIQINNLKGEMQQNISDSESYLLRFSMGLEQLINESADISEIKSYINSQQIYYEDLSAGNCFNVYAAAGNWTIIPNFDMPKDYHAVERVWYTGAKQHPGEVFISEPYIDANTGMLCYTFSYILSDGETVAAMDYTLSRVQDIVARMVDTEDQFAMIITDDGTIVGCSEVGYQGKALKKAMPQYEDAFTRVKASNEHRSFRTKIDGRNRIVFGSETTNGWRLVLVVDHSAFYSQIVNQMILLGAIDLLMVAVIIVFYMVSINNQEKAENTLATTEKFIASLSEDLRNPLNEIMRISDTYSRQGGSEEAFKGISIAGNRLKEKMDNLFSYSNILKSDAADAEEIRKKKKRKASASARFIRSEITLILIVVLLVGMSLCVGTTARWGSARIQNEADRYDNEVTLWMQQKQSILRMFSDVIAADPHVLDDYDSAVKWLNDITSNYNDMTFAYMANPYNEEHPVIMNNGWVPDDYFNLEERQWYIDTERSDDGFSISSPYFDVQTGLYCITFSRSVFTPDGEFLGVFAIDCLLDNLIDVLDDSYTEDSYAFMVDQNGTIINHPYEAYEINTRSSVNIEDTVYSEAYHNGSVFGMWDYDEELVVCLTEKNETSGFTVVVVRSWWGIYGPVIIVGLIFLWMITISLVAITRMIGRFTRWQEEANKKLVEAADTAVAAEKAKSRFLAQMSHEIRTPINTVLGMNEMILRESDDEPIREYAGSIRSAGRNLLGLINSILDFSKIEEGKMDIMPVKYDTVSMIENIINSVANRAADKGLEFRTHIDSDLPISLFGDDMRVSQVAVNLLTNAVKYTREGSVDLYIGGTKLDDETLKLRVSVEDTGIGIKEEDIDKLFESFTRLEETRNRNIEGTGLGMAIVNGLLKMMGSKLEVESEYGKGSRFSFEVEQTIVDAEPIGDYEAKAKEALDREEEGTYLYAPDARILVVDDNKMNLKVIENLLKLNGIKPDMALSGHEALDKMKKGRYDVVLLDHMMPQMDGIETLSKAREEAIIPGNCAVIALTANAVVGARESYISAGFDDYLSKPVEVASMERALGKYLPKDKVSYKSRTADKAAKKTSLQVVGINTEDGLKYCAGDEDFYRETLRDYMDSYDERKADLEDALSLNDAETYAIKVHALKSISRTVGAEEVADAAAELEKAAREGDIDVVRAGHEDMFIKFKKTVDIIDSMNIPKNENPEDDKLSGEENIILEFLPEQEES